MRNFPASPRNMLASLWRNRELVRALVEREVAGRYRSSVMGILWSFINPLVMLSVYTYVFSVVFKARWSVENGSKVDFALVLFSGLIIFNLFSECINQAPNLVLANPNYVKKVVFPLEILPWVSLFSAIFHALVSLFVWFVVYIVVLGLPHITVLYLPYVILPLISLIMGMSWFLASLGIFLRDVTQFIGHFTTVLMYLTPIFYPASVLPEAYRKLIYLNPLTLIIEQSRDVIYWGKPPDFYALGILLIINSLIACLGFAFFQKTRKGFADVI